MSEVVGRSQMDYVLYEGRAQIAAETEKLMQTMLDKYGTGIYVQKVTLQNTQPPEQVQAAFDDAVKASQDRERQKNEGQAYANDIIPRARGTASRLLQEADGYNASVVQRAEGDASRFRQILVEYAKAPAVTRERLYLDMMQSVLGNSSKVLIDQKSGSSNLLYLPLDQLLKQGLPGGTGPTVIDATRPVAPAPDAAVTIDPAAQPRTVTRPGSIAMKAVMPVLALLVAIAAGACRSRSTRSTSGNTRSSSSSANSSKPRRKPDSTSRCRSCRTSSSTTGAC